MLYVVGHSLHCTQFFSIHTPAWATSYVTLQGLLSEAQTGCIHDVSRRLGVWVGMKDDGGEEVLCPLVPVPKEML